MISHIKESLAIFLLLIRSSVPHESFLVKWSVKLKPRTSWSPEYCVQINDMVIMFHHLLPSSNSPQGTSFSAAIYREFDIEGILSGLQIKHSSDWLTAHGNWVGTTEWWTQFYLNLRKSWLTTREIVREETELHTLHSPSSIQSNHSPAIWKVCA